MPVANMSPAVMPGLSRTFFLDFVQVVAFDASSPLALFFGPFFGPEFPTAAPTTFLAAEDLSFLAATFEFPPVAFLFPVARSVF